MKQWKSLSAFGDALKKTEGKKVTVQDHALHPSFVNRLVTFSKFIELYAPSSIGMQPR